MLCKTLYLLRFTRLCWDLQEFAGFTRVCWVYKSFAGKYKSLQENTRVSTDLQEFARITRVCWDTKQAPNIQNKHPKYKR